MSMERSRSVYLVSACLLGLKTRYDGRLKPCVQCMTALGDAVWIPICPEQLGGLATPRPPALLTGGNGADVLLCRAKVVTSAGVDVSRQFIQGARQVLRIAQSQPLTGIFLKSKSPSCGVHAVLGVTAALLQQHGFAVREF